MKNYITRYGLYAGGLLVVLGILNWLLIAPNGYKISEIFGYASMVAALMMVPAGLKYFRDQVNNGELSFGHGMKIGLGITLITSVIMWIYSALFFILQGDKFMEWSKEHLSAEEWEMAQAQMEAMGDVFMSPWFQGFIMFMTVFIIGLLITLVSAIIMKKQ